MGALSLIAAALAIALSPPTAHAQTDCGTAVLCDGFEDQTGSAPSGAWSVTYPDCQGTGAAAIDTEVSHGGGSSLRIDGEVGYCNHVFVESNEDLSGLGQTWYARFYMRHTTALPTSHVTFMAMNDSADGDRDLRMGGQNGALQWNRESDDATLPEQSPSGVALSEPLPTDQWTCVQFAVDGSAGTLQTWIDGHEVTGLAVDGVPTHDIDGQWLNRGSWNPALTDFRIGWESYGEGADTLWYDDIALSSSPVGCEGDPTDPPTDPTDPPTDPTDPPTDPPTGPTDPPVTESDCTAVAQVNSWGSGATVNVTVSNTGDRSLSGWAVNWTWPGAGTAVTNIWNARHSSADGVETAEPVGWNQSIAANGSTEFGFNVSGSLSSLPDLECASA